MEALSEQRRCRNWFIWVAALVATVLALGAVAAHPGTAQATTKSGYTFPSTVSAKVGEIKTVYLSMPSNELANVAWGYNNYYGSNRCEITKRAIQYGSYWGKPASFTFTCPKAGTTRISASVTRYDKTTKRQIGTVYLSTTVYVKSASSSVALRSISLSRSSLALTAGKSSTLSVRYNPTNTTVAKKVTWTSGNRSVATVSSRGVVRGVRAGSTTVTATVGGKRATCRVTVRSAARTRTTTTTSGGYLSASQAYTALNSFRASNGKGALARNTRLESTAKVRAKELATSFSHTRPNGQRCFTAFPSSTVMAENIASGQTTATAVTNAWAGSAGHRANMLNTNVNAVGIACYKAPNGRCYWAQCFAKM